MSTVVGATARCCVNLQLAIDSTQDIAPDATRLKLGTLEALRSSANTDSVRVAQSVRQLGEFARPDGVGDCKMEIEFELPDCVNAATSEIDICGSLTSVSDTRGYLEQTISLYAGRSGTFTLAEFDCLCERPDERLAKTIRRLARSIDKQMEIQAATSITSFLSNYANGDDSTDVVGGNTRQLNIINVSHVNAAEWAKLRAEYRKQFSMDDPIIVGGDILAQYDDIRLAGLGANAIGNTNPDQLVAGNRYISYELDAAVDTALGSPARPANTSYAYSWMPGAIQLLEFMENKGDKEWFFEKSTRTTINIDGVMYDWYLLFEECSEPTWKFKLEKRYDFFHIPDSVYSACFPSNGNLLWLLGCGDGSCPTDVA
jgi:hypothetical protein